MNEQQRIRDLEMALERVMACLRDGCTASRDCDRQREQATGIAWNALHEDEFYVAPNPATIYI